MRNIKAMLGGNPQAIFQNMLKTNPQFRSFAESVKGKTPEQAFSEYGLDFNEVKALMR